MCYHDTYFCKANVGQLDCRFGHFWTTHSEALQRPSATATHGPPPQLSLPAAATMRASCLTSGAANVRPVRRPQHLLNRQSFRPHPTQFRKLQRQTQPQPRRQTLAVRSQLQGDIAPAAQGSQSAEMELLLEKALPSPQYVKPASAAAVVALAAHSESTESDAPSYTETYRHSRCCTACRAHIGVMGQEMLPVGGETNNACFHHVYTCRCGCTSHKNCLPH